MASAVGATRHAGARDIRAEGLIASAACARAALLGAKVAAEFLLPRACSQDAAEACG